MSLDLTKTTTSLPSNHDFIQDTWKTGDSEGKLRAKFTVLAFGGQAVIGTFQFVNHIVQLFFDTVDIDVSAKLAEKEWCTYKYNNPDAKLTYYAIVLKHHVLELAKDITRIVTFPLYLVAREMVAIYGIANPLEARKIYADLENLYSRSYRKEHDLSPVSSIIYSDYSAPCMQPYHVWIEQNFYRYFHNYQVDSTTTLPGKLYRSLYQFSDWELIQKPFQKFQQLFKESFDSLHINEVNERERSTLVEKNLTENMRFLQETIDHVKKGEPEKAREKIEKLNQTLNHLEEILTHPLPDLETESDSDSLFGDCSFIIDDYINDSD